MHLQQEGAVSPATKVSNPDQFLDEEGAADLLGLSRSYLSKLRVAGGGPLFSKYGARAVRYRVGDLLTWAASKSARSTSELAG